MILRPIMAIVMALAASTAQAWGREPSSAQTCPALTGQGKVTVLGESRTIDCQEGRFQDEFKPWDVHLYRIQAEQLPDKG